MTTKGLRPAPPIRLPDEWAHDYSMRLAIHEGGHVAANHIMGRATHSVQISERTGLTRVEPTDDEFAVATTLLVPLAYEVQVLGLAPAGSHDDRDQAEVLLARRFSGRTLDAACEVIADAAIAIARSERFARLTHAVAGRLHRERYLGRRQLAEILQQNDPEAQPRWPRHPAASAGSAAFGFGSGLERHGRPMAPVSRICHEDGSVSLYSYGRLLLHRGTEEEVEQMAQEITERVWAR